MSQPFTLYHSDSLGRASNCMYPHAVEVTDAASLTAAVSFDYVAVEYKNGYRNNANFIKTNCLMLDCDNGHSEDPAAWITPQVLADSLLGVSFAVHYSRNNGKAKNGKAARPKFHVFFPIPEQTDPVAYSDMKRRLQNEFPFFDSNALDAARFFFGTNPPEVEFFDGDLTIADFLGDRSFEDLEMPVGATIPEGHRNSRLSHFAGRVLKRLGNTQEAHDAFLAEAAKCDPPLEYAELTAIWRSALRFNRRVQQQEGYIPPEEYNVDFLYCPDDFTDVGQAEVLARVSGGELRYSPATDYICYNGTYWEESKHGAQAVAQRLTACQLEEATSAAEDAWAILTKNGAAEILAAMSKKKAESMLTKDQTAAYIKYKKAAEYKSFALDRRGSRNITNTLKEARPMLAITPKELDADCYLLCTPEATYDLRQGMAGRMEHRPGDFMTKVTSVSPSDKGADLWQKQLGLDGAQSSLFYQASRIIKEMRCATNGRYPRWICWENVVGAFSSNRGFDFKAVLEAVIGIIEPGAEVPMPEKERWPYADIYMGERWSVAYRTFDAQHWGVPQRRRRVYLVGDLAGQCAGQVLFESEGLSGYSAEGFRSWQRAARNPAAGLGAAGGICLNDQGGSCMDISFGVSGTLRAQMDGHPPCIVEPGAAVYENHSQDTRYTGPLDTAPTVSSTYGTGGNNQPFVVQADTPKTLKIRSGCEGGGKGALIQEDMSATLSCNNDQTLFVPKCYSIGAAFSEGMLSDNPRSGIYEADSSRTLDQNGGNPSCNQGGIAVVEGPTYAVTTGKYTQVSAEQAPTLMARDFKDPTAVNRGYSVRRLTPTECARLQGFPDFWCAGLDTPEPTEADIAFWTEVWETHRRVVGGSAKAKSRNQIIKWLQHPHSDAAEYKMWGNGVALPNVFFVLAGIVWSTQLSGQ